MKFVCIGFLVFFTTASFAQFSSEMDTVKNKPEKKDIDLATPFDVNATEQLSDPDFIKKDFADTLSVPSVGDSLDQKMNIEGAIAISISPDSIGSDSSRFQLVRQKVSGKSQPSVGLPKPKKIRAVQDTVQSKADKVNQKIAEKQQGIANRQRAMQDTVQQKLNKGINKLTGNSAGVDSVNDLTGTSGQKIKNLQNQQEQKVEQVKNKVTGHLDEFSQSELPTEEIPGLPTTGNTADQLPGELRGIGDVNADLPGTKAMPTQDIGVPGIDRSLGQEGDNPLNDLIPEEVNEVKNMNVNDKIEELTDIDVGEKMEDVKEITDRPLEKAGEMNELGKVGDVATGVGEIGNKAGEMGKEASGYGNDIKSIQDGDLGAIEDKYANKAAAINEIKMLEENRKMMEDQVAGYEDQMASYEEQVKILREQQNMELLEEELAKKVKENVVEHFIGHEEQLEKAHKMLFEYKRKHPNVKSIKNIHNEKSIEMAKKSLWDRLMIGTDFQVIRDMDMTYFDTNPYLGYKFSNKVSVYGGYVWRFHTQFGNGFSMRKTNVHGIRGGASYMFYKGFSVAGHYERLHSASLSQAEDARLWHQSVLVGAMKRYKIVKSLYGSAQFLYNITFDKEGLYDRRVNVRFGLYWDLKKRNHPKKDKKQEKDISE